MHPARNIPKEYMPTEDYLVASISFEPTSGCWIWARTVTPLGYGIYRINRNEFRAHRVVYQFYKGMIPEGLVLDHICRNTSCVNPDHLRAVTDQVNTLAGVGPSSSNAKKKVCPKCGGPYSVIPTNGYRICKPCRKRHADSKWDQRKAVKCPYCEIECKQIKRHIKNIHGVTP